LDVWAAEKVANLDEDRLRLSSFARRTAEGGCPYMGFRELIYRTTFALIPWPSIE
jgi:hypothetical protein